MSLRPRLHVPAGSSRLLLAASAAFVATWSLGGFYQAFGPSVAAEYLGTTNSLVAAAMFASVMVLNPIGGPLTARWSPTKSVRMGMSIFALAVLAIIGAMRVGLLGPFIMASLMVGVAQGAASTGAIRALLSNAPQEARAGLLSTIYLVSYCGAAIPGMIAAHAAIKSSVFSIAVGYATLGIIAAAVAGSTIPDWTRSQELNSGVPDSFDEIDSTSGSRGDH
jgi:MFS family permease